MIQKEQLEQAVNQFIEGRDLFLVGIDITADNDIDVIIESDKRDINLDDCVGMSEFIETKLNRDVEDFSLTVGSAGLSSPFRVARQYLKFIDQLIELTFSDGHRQKVTLCSVDEEQIQVSYERLVPVDGKKKKVRETVDEILKFSDFKSAKAVINYK